MPYLGASGDVPGANIKSYRYKQGTDTSTGATSFPAVNKGADELRVYLNGALLKLTADYTFTTSAVTISPAPADDDEIQIDVYTSMNLADTVSSSDGGNFVGAVTFQAGVKTGAVKAQDGTSAITIADSTGKVTIPGDLEIQGTTTTIDTNVESVDKLEVGANSSDYAVSITQSGAGVGLDINGSELVLDADADTSIHALTDDQIDIKVGGTDKVTIDSTALKTDDIQEKTTDHGVEIEQVTLKDGDVSFGDNKKAQFGAGNDLQIYHDGSNSYVDDAGTGRLYLRGNDRVQIQKYTGEDMVTATVDDGVKLYHDNAKKIETTSTGVQVTGSVSSTVSGGSNATFDKSTGGSIAFKQGGTATSLIEDLQSSGGIGFYTGTGGSLTKHIEINNTGSLKILTAGQGITFQDVGHPTLASGQPVSQANTLKYYEEGDFDVGTTTTSSDPSINNCKYVRIGQLVHVQIYVVWTNNANSTSTSTFYITGLPFNCQANSYFGGAPIGYVGSANMNDAVGIVYSGGNSLYFHQNDGDSNPLRNNNIHSRGLTELIISATYYAN